MPQLDNYLVTLGVKGQNVVLAQMDKIRKKGKDISRSKVIANLAASGGLTRGAGRTTPEKIVNNQKLENEKIKNMHKPDAKNDTPPGNSKDDENANKMGQAVKKFGRGADRFANAAATLSPTSFIQSIASTLPFLGAVAMAAGGALESAKTSTAGAYELSKRNAATKYYGGEQIQGRRSLNNKRGFLSNSEHAMFTAAVSGSMGKIQKPLADAINGLIGKKDTRALARAAAGDWEATGTDKGWIASQMMSGTEGLPPSIRQKISAAMLKNFGGEIQEAPEEQRTRQRRAAYYEDSQEKQTTRLADTAATATFVNASGKVVKSMEAMNDALNDMQNAMVNGAGKMVTAISFITDAAMNSKKNPTIAKPPIQAGFEALVNSIRPNK